MKTGQKEVDGQTYRPNTTGVSHANPLGLPELSLPEPRQPWRWVGLFAFVLISMAMLATVIVVTASRDKKASLLQAEQDRLQESVFGRVKVLETWLEGQRAVSRRLTESHVFRLFITDVGAKDLHLPLPRSLQDQRPYFQQLLTDYAEQNTLVRATVLRDDGAILLSSPGPALPIANLLRMAGEAKPGWRVLYSPIRHREEPEGGFVIDAMVTIPEPQAEHEFGQSASAYLVSTLDISPILETVLANKRPSSAGEEIAIFQHSGDAVDKIWATTEGLQLAAETVPAGIGPDISFPFERRNSDRPVYSISKTINDVRWSLYQAVDARAALEPVHRFVATAAILAAIAVLALTTAFSSVWWRQDRNHHRRLADVYKEHAERVDQQRQFLLSVTTSIGDWLTVTAPDGRIVYANPSFEKVVRRRQTSVIGQRWEDLVKTPTATEAPQQDLTAIVDANSFEIIEIGGEQQTVSTNISDLRGDDGGIEGTVRIIRNQSDLVLERMRRLQSLAETVNAFIHAVELRDPFLLGHTRRLRTHAIAIGTAIGLSQNDLAALALAASLSQIGKIFIPDDVLAKPDRHDPAEEDIMKRHIVHAIDILKPIDFDLPVVDSLGQMHERLDGSGYPYGLAGEEITTNARILAVADVFCARTAPRSYRDRLSASKALFHLADNGKRYDLMVVAALASVVGTDQEVDDVGTLDQTFIDSAIWQKKQDQESDPKAAHTASMALG